MKTHIKHYLFEKLWNATRDILPYEVEIKSEFYEQEIDTQKFEQLFPSVALSTVALISTKLAETGIIISLQNLCDFKLTEAFEKSLIVFTIDLTQVDVNFRTHLISESVEKEPDDEPLEIKPIKWSNLLEVSDSEDFNQKIESIEKEYPNSIVYGLFNPWENVITELTLKGFSLTSDQKEQIEQSYLDFIETSDLLISLNEVTQEKMDQFKTLAMRHVIGSGPGSLKIGPNKNIKLKVRLEPICFDEDYSVEEAAEVLNVSSDSWICDTRDMVLIAESIDIPPDCHEPECNVEINGDFFIFSNCQDKPLVDTTSQFYVIPMHRLADEDADSILRNIYSSY